MLHGEITLRLNGTEHRLIAGDGANIPAGTTYSTTILSATARWAMASGNGNGAEFWDRAGLETAAFIYPLKADCDADCAKLGN